MPGTKEISAWNFEQKLIHDHLENGYEKRYCLPKKVSFLILLLEFKREESIFITVIQVKINFDKFFPVKRISVKSKFAQYPPQKKERMHG